MTRGAAWLVQDLAAPAAAVRCLAQAVRCVAADHVPGRRTEC